LRTHSFVFLFLSISHRKELKKKFKGLPPLEENHKIFSGVIFPRPHHYCQGQQNTAPARCRWKHGGGMAAAAASAAVAAARSVATVHSVTAAARWQQCRGCGGATSAAAVISPLPLPLISEGILAG